MEDNNTIPLMENGTDLEGSCSVYTDLSDESLIYSETLKICQSRRIGLKGLDGPVKVRIPVILSLTEIDIDLKADLALEDSASAILDNRESIFLDECIILSDVKTLFISGHIRKAIEYAPMAAPDSTVNHNVRHTVFNIPFKCAAEVEYFTPPQMCKTDRVPPDSEDKIKRSQEVSLNEKIRCELVSTRIAKSREIEELEKSCLEPCIQRIEEKIALTLTIRLVQNHDVNIYPGS